jgi:hypothetical protein
MKATVVQIESGDRYTDKLRRATLRFEGARVGMDAITVPVTSLPEGVGLDDVLDFSVLQTIGRRTKVDPKEEPQWTKGDGNVSHT